MLAKLPFKANANSATNRVITKTLALNRIIALPKKCLGLLAIVSCLRGRAINFISFVQVALLL